MSENKTRPTDDDVLEFLNAVEHKIRREDSLVLLEMMQEITGEEPVLWGSIVGFGSYHYKYASGREGDWMMVGFSPRKQNLSVYIMPGFDAYENTLNKLGKHKIGKACLYINKLADVDLNILRKLIRDSYMQMKQPN